MPKVSVIIPVYNVEKYLGRALDSLIAQTHPDWEAIIVDDGSTDGSAHIADEYARKDCRFRLFRQPNQGQAVARNKALEKCAGSYIMYLDPDDMLHRQAMEICVNAAERDGSDMVTFKYDHLYRSLNKLAHKYHMGDIKPWQRHYSNPAYFVTENIFQHAAECNHPVGVIKQWKVKNCQAWRCFLRIDLARKAQFAEGVKYEDVPWWGEILINVRRTTITRLPLYYYYPSPQSFIMSASTAEHIRSLEVILQLSDGIYEQAKPQQREAWNANFRNAFAEILEDKRREEEQEKARL